MGFQSGPIGRTLRIAAVAVVGLAALEGVARAQNVGIFQSAVSSDANLGGLAGADARCELEGTTVIPGSGPWVAWLSTDDSGPGPIENARNRIAVPGGGAYVRASAPTIVIATSLAELTDGMLDNPVGILDAAGNPVVTNGIWTGTAPDGTLAAGLGTCLNWTDGNAPVRVAAGFSSATDSRWTQLPGNPTCDARQFVDPPHIYCIGPLPTGVPTLPNSALVALAILLVASAAYQYRRRQAHD